MRGEGFRYLATRMFVIETQPTVGFSLISVVLYEYCKSESRVTILRVPLIIANSLVINFTRNFNLVALPYFYPICKTWVKTCFMKPSNIQYLDYCYIKIWKTSLLEFFLPKWRLVLNCFPKSSLIYNGLLYLICLLTCWWKSIHI